MLGEDEPQGTCSILRQGEETEPDKDQEDEELDYSKLNHVNG